MIHQLLPLPCVTLQGNLLVINWSLPFYSTSVKTIKQSCSLLRGGSRWPGRSVRNFNVPSTHIVPINFKSRWPRLTLGYEVWSSQGKSNCVLWRMPVSWILTVILLRTKITIHLLIRRRYIREPKNRKTTAQPVRKKPLYILFIRNSWYQYRPLVSSSNSKTKARPEDSSHCISFSSTHRAMNNVDILLIVVEWLYPNLFALESSKDEVRERQCALAMLARTCKSFKDIALATLWRDQDGFDTILNLGRSKDGRTVRGSLIMGSLMLILPLISSGWQEQDHRRCPPIYSTHKKTTLRWCKNWWRSRNSHLVVRAGQGDPNISEGPVPSTHPLASLT